MRAHKLGAVQQGKAFLGLETDGLPAQFLPDFGRRPDLPLIKHFAEADERQAQMREGGEVAGRPERSLLVHYRQDVVVEHIDEPLDRDQLSSGMTVCEALRLEEQHQLDDLRTNGLAGAAGVRHHEVVLELREVLERDGDIVQRSESGGNAVERAVYVFHLAVKILAAFDDVVRGFVGERDLFAVVEYLLHPLQGEAGG